MTSETPPMSSALTVLVVGDQSLTIECSEILRAAGHTITAVVTGDARVRRWSEERGVAALPDAQTALDSPSAAAFDYLLSIANLKLLPPALVSRARFGAVNFHDGPLPRYAGLNAPAWALMAGEQQHGITWHVMTDEVDAGDVLLERAVAVDDDDTSFTLNARCYEVGIQSFAELVPRLASRSAAGAPQDLSLRTYFARAERPRGLATLDWRQPAAHLDRVVRALDFGPYRNPLAVPKVWVGSRLLVARRSQVLETGDAATPGTIKEVGERRLVVACAQGALALSDLTDMSGAAVDVRAVAAAEGLRVGSRLPVSDDARLDAVDRLAAQIAPHDGRFRALMRRFTPTEAPAAGAESTVRTWHEWDGRTARPDTLLAAIVLVLARITQSPALAFGFVPSSRAVLDGHLRAYVHDVVPVEIACADADAVAELAARVAAAAAHAETAVGMSRDLLLREGAAAALESPDRAPIRVVRATGLLPDTARAAAGAAVMTFQVTDDGRMGLLVDAGLVSPDIAREILASIGQVVPVVEDGLGRVADVDLLTRDQRERLMEWARGDAPDGVAPLPDVCVHELFEAQVARSPGHVACVCRGQELTYADLNQAANRLARHLRTSGVGTGDRVGVMVDRSLEMVVVLYAVHKAGAAYVPLDPKYPSERLGLVLAGADVRCLVVRVATSGVDAAIPQVVLEDVWPRLAELAPDNLGALATPDDLAYVIYTSGSSGTPKGVMVEHRNVVNFFAGMDRRIDRTPGTWLAVTSISFDISVLELFWTLARGFTVVLHADGPASASLVVPQAARAKGIEFGLFYWNVASPDSDHAQEKYRLLLESAKYADANGFTAVWTPERHFASFGGLYPNPAVTSAALAMVTSRVALRAGSCVVPLHHPIRIAEEWAVVDNLSGGRVGMSVASGWATPDFAIRPEAFEGSKRLLFENTAIVKRLWRGETVEFPGPKGPVQVRTLPRPLQKELPVWVTTAGNVETFVSAGRMGANLLTHLLGQTVEEVAEKVAAYRAAWRDAGHAGRGIVTLMLHTFVGPDPDEVERIVRGPMKEYLRSAANLVKAAAWQFPTFKRLSDEQGKTLDDFFNTIAEDDMDALLEFAFQRYFRTSGLFGTVEECQAMVGRVDGADIDEIACLIDYGIDTDVVLEHLPYLNALRESVQARGDDRRHSLAGLLGSGVITHFQCTPSMARMVLAEPAATVALGELREVLVGGEALPPDVADALATAAPGRVTNVYGPTETTVWSAASRVSPGGGAVPIGTPLLNQQLYVLDSVGRPLPPGVPGELVIGGMGVTRGYWNLDASTRERFVADTLSPRPAARMYRTGDRGRVRPDGQFECLGRLDQQVKIRGYRVEPGEIEARLCEHAGIAEAAVMLREDRPGDQRLVAYVRPAPSQRPAPDDVRRHAAERLPEYMVPSMVVVLDQMPRTPNGKLDRRALPAPDSVTAPAAPAASASAATLSTGVSEPLVTEVWEHALGVPVRGRQDNFFDLGGHSLLVVQVLAELRKRVKKPLALTDLFKYTTVESLAAFIDGQQVSTRTQAGARASRRRDALARRERAFE